MEEKERFELFGEHCIKDNSPDARPQLLGAYVACVILNEQDKRIKELEEENNELKDFTENTANLIDKLTEDSVSASKQLAIKELEKLKDELDSRKLEYKTMENSFHIRGLKIERIFEIIDDRIKELKGE